MACLENCITPYPHTNRCILPLSTAHLSWKRTLSFYNTICPRSPSCVLLLLSPSAGQHCLRNSAPQRCWCNLDLFYKIIKYYNFCSRTPLLLVAHRVLRFTSTITKSSSVLNLCNFWQLSFGFSRRSHWRKYLAVAQQCVDSKMEDSSSRTEEKMLY